MLNYKNFITSDYRIMLGKPIIKGTRITVELVLKKLSENSSINDIIEMYPNLTSEQVLACIEYAAEVISNEEVLEFA